MHFITGQAKQSIKQILSPQCPYHPEKSTLAYTQASHEQGGYQDKAILQFHTWLARVEVKFLKGKQT